MVTTLCLATTGFGFESLMIHSKYSDSGVMVWEYADIAGKYGLSPASLSIAFVLKHPLVASAVFGATKAWQLREVLQASKIHLTMEIIAEINKVHARYPNPCP
ncbi:uncharacterized protein [Elaeis guineensis]|uniref:uncharacterized protein n=1 Tax=Elaeis guineensis var. tenera TaxID=51953 RepID=UPI003C6D5E10